MLILSAKGHHTHSTRVFEVLWTSPTTSTRSLIRPCEPSQEHLGIFFNYSASFTRNHEVDFSKLRGPQKPPRETLKPSEDM